MTMLPADTRKEETYKWFPGRDAETRPPGFVQCYLGNCRSNNNCRKQRRKRELFSCVLCYKRKCRPKRKADRWKPLILNEEHPALKLYIPGKKNFLTRKRGRNIGHLYYNISRDGAGNNGKPYVFIDFLYTNDEYRGKGVGRALMEGLMESIVIKENFKEVKLNVMNGRENKNATALYERMGFL
ncbi:acetyltransferase (GNAT) family domain-containing protein [Ditylenchus destructor]|uniref:Acetyltransferase (GNAT) family domain-containing protein n=1 Tax=Ditylenchus destructor TaxID=166010 RepID=A0AAD4MIM1_9BILA|nr:acetyltransferase (GNAT) family domain-containing protein [Ditylenchus destructor]